MKRLAFALLLAPALAHAGMDGYYTLASATGKVEVRSYPLGKWRPLRVRGIVPANSEVRTGVGAKAVLESGVVPDAKRHMFIDDWYSVVTIGPKSLFRTLDPTAKAKVPQGRIVGTVVIKKQHGLLPHPEGGSLKPPQ